MKKRRSDLVILITLTAVFISLVAAWFAINTMTNKIVGFSVSEQGAGNGNHKSPAEPRLLSFLSINEGDIISGELNAALQVNASNANIKKVAVYLLGNNDMTLITYVNATNNRKFFDIMIDTREFPDELCGYKLMAEIFTTARRRYVFSDIFSIINAPAGIGHSGEFKKHEINSGSRKIEMDILEDYAVLAGDKISVSDKGIYVDKSLFCAIDSSKRILLTFENLSFIEPEIFSDGNLCRELCFIKSYRDGKLTAEVSGFGNFEVREGFRFFINIFNPSLEKNKFSAGELVPFYANITDAYGNLIKDEEVTCISEFFSGGIVTSLNMENDNGVYKASAMFNSTGLFDWRVICLNNTSQYEKEAKGKFRIRKE